MITEAAAKHAGLVMAHAAAIASVLEPGELICPFVVVTEGENRRSVAFESETQDQAVDRAWSSLEEYRGHVDLWAMAREGLIKGQAGKDDVLVVAAWSPEMSSAVAFTQRFCPNAQGFAIIGPLMIGTELGTEAQLVAQWFFDGVAEHPKGKYWATWCDAAQQIAAGDAANPRA
jgi:hypothetical protein